MYICPNCGRSVPDEQVCGCQGQAQNSVGFNAPPCPPPYANTANQPYAPVPVAGVPVIEYIKSAFISKQFLTAAILISASMGLNILSGFIEHGSRGFYLGINIGLLILIGMWMLFCSAKSSPAGTVSVAGLTVMRVYSIVGIVFSSIVFGIVGIIFLTIGFMPRLLYDFLDMLREYGYTGQNPFTSIQSDLVTIVCLIAFIFAAAVYFLYLFYFAKLGNTIKNIRNTGRTALPDSKISSFVIVMNKIIIVLTILSALSNLARGFSFSSGIEAFNSTGNIAYNFVSLLDTGCMAAFLILINNMLVKYRRDMELMCNGIIPEPFVNASAPEYQQQFYGSEAPDGQYYPPSSTNAAGACPNCGKPYGDDELFCSGCGTKLK